MSSNSGSKPVDPTVQPKVDLGTDLITPGSTIVANKQAADAAAIAAQKAADEQKLREAEAAFNGTNKSQILGTPGRKLTLLNTALDSSPNLLNGG